MNKFLCFAITLLLFLGLIGRFTSLSPDLTIYADVFITVAEDLGLRPAFLNHTISISWRHHKCWLKHLTMTLLFATTQGILILLFLFTAFGLSIFFLCRYLLSKIFNGLSREAIFLLSVLSVVILIPVLITILSGRWSHYKNRTTLKFPM